MCRGGNATFDLVHVHNFQTVVAARIVCATLSGAKARTQSKSSNTPHAVDTNAHDYSP